MLYKNGIDLNTKLLEYVKGSNSLFIYCPYIKLETLKAILEGVENVKAVFVRWETKDLVLGASDLEIYPYLRNRGITLYRNARLHLKAYVDDCKRCFVTSANISARALNIPQYNAYNFEIGTLVDNLDIDDRLYFNIIECDSLLITDNIYNQFKEQLPEKKKEFPGENEFTFKIEAPDKHFLISSLPMTYSVETLYRIYEDKEYISDLELNCVLHDLAIYKIPLGLNSVEFRDRLKAAFFNHPFVKGFLENIDSNGEVYFGMAKEWIHSNCADVPTPRKWEITENIQILYRWVVKLGEGRYIVDRPNHSERLKLS
jgi:hypothetical protein